MKTKNILLSPFFALLFSVFLFSACGSSNTDSSVPQKEKMDSPALDLPTPVAPPEVENVEKQTMTINSVMDINAVPTKTCTTIEPPVLPQPEQGYTYVTLANGKNYGFGCDLCPEGSNAGFCNISEGEKGSWIRWRAGKKNSYCDANWRNWSEANKHDTSLGGKDGDYLGALCASHGFNDPRYYYYWALIKPNKYPFTVTVNGIGNITSGTTINCGDSGNTCGAEIDWGTEIQLTATPDTNVIWGTQCPDGKITMDATTKSCIVTFAETDIQKAEQGEECSEDTDCAENLSCSGRDQEGMKYCTATTEVPDCPAGATCGYGCDDAAGLTLEKEDDRTMILLAENEEARKGLTKDEIEGKNWGTADVACYNDGETFFWQIKETGDTKPSVSFTKTALSAKKEVGNGNEVTITLNVSGNVTNEFTVPYVISNQDLTRGTDYENVDGEVKQDKGTFTVSPGDTTVLARYDILTEQVGSFTMNLDTAAAEAVYTLGNNTSVTVTIEEEKTETITPKDVNVSIEEPEQGSTHEKKNGGTLTFKINRDQLTANRDECYYSINGAAEKNIGTGAEVGILHKDIPQGEVKIQLVCKNRDNNNEEVGSSEVTFTFGEEEKALHIILVSNEVGESVTIINKDNDDEKECRVNCEYTFPENSELTLTINPLDGRSGSFSGNPCPIAEDGRMKMDENKICTVNFKELTLTEERADSIAEATAECSADETPISVQLDVDCNAGQGLTTKTFSNEEETGKYSIYGLVELSGDNQAGEDFALGVNNQTAYTWNTDVASLGQAGTYHLLIGNNIPLLKGENAVYLKHARDCSNGSPASVHIKTLCAKRTGDTESGEITEETVQEVQENIQTLTNIFETKVNNNIEFGENVEIEIAAMDVSEMKVTLWVIDVSGERTKHELQVGITLTQVNSNNMQINAVGNSFSFTLPEIEHVAGNTYSLEVEAYDSNGESVTGGQPLTLPFIPSIPGFDVGNQPENGAAENTDEEGNSGEPAGDNNDEEQTYVPEQGIDEQAQQEWADDGVEELEGADGALDFAPVREALDNIHVTLRKFFDENFLPSLGKLSNGLGNNKIRFAVGDGSENTLAWNTIYILNTQDPDNVTWHNVNLEGENILFYNANGSVNEDARGWIHKMGTIDIPKDEIPCNPNEQYCPWIGWTWTWDEADQAYYHASGECRYVPATGEGSCTKWPIQFLDMTKI